MEIIQEKGQQLLKLLITTVTVFLAPNLPLAMQKIAYNRSIVVWSSVVLLEIYSFSHNFLGSF